MKKLLAMILALTMLLCLLSGCGETAETAPEPEETETPAEAPAEEPAEEELPEYAKQLLEKMNTHAADTVVLTVNGAEIRWNLFYYLLAGGLQEYAYYMQELPADFTMGLSDGTSMEDYFNKLTLDQAKMIGAVVAMAKEKGVTPAPENDEEIIAGWEELCTYYGGEEAIREISYMTRDTYMDIMRFDLSTMGVQTQLYGEEGELVPDEDITAWGLDNSYVRVKHILYKYENEDGTAMDDAGKAEVMAKAETVLGELQALAGDSEALESRFDEIMTAESADAGALAAFPDGYTFTTGAMVQSFEEAAFALADYELSGVVESDYGCHILLRLPLRADDPTMTQSSTNGMYYTLRHLAVSHMFSQLMEEWIADAEIVWAEGFEDFSVVDLFPENVSAAAE